VDPKRKYWDVFDTGKCLEIERIDDPEDGSEPAFDTDFEAQSYVLDRACRDACPDARSAIRKIVASWEQDAPNAFDVSVEWWGTEAELRALIEGHHATTHVEVVDKGPAYEVTDA
jgi:hypothetical protein